MAHLTRFTMSCSIVTSVVLATGAQAATEYTFQQGANGYAGTNDNWLNGIPGSHAQDNGGHALLAVRGGNRSNVSQSHTDYELLNSVISFGDLGITPGTQVQSATLTLKVGGLGNDFDDNEPAMIDVFEIVRPWTEAGSSWNNAAAGTAWGTPGARQAEVDRSATPIASVVAGTLAVGDTVQITLPAEVVQAWVDGTAGHHGLLLRMSDEPFDSFQVNFHSSEATNVGDRPTLTVNAIPEPATAALMLAAGVCVAGARRPRQECA